MPTSGQMEKLGMGLVIRIGANIRAWWNDSDIDVRLDWKRKVFRFRRHKRG